MEKIKASFQMFVGEVQVLFPVEGGYIVLAGSNVITNPSMNRLVWRRLSLGTKLMAKQLVNWLRAEGGKKFSFWVRPLVALCGSDIDRARGRQGDQHVLINRAFAFLVVVLFIVVAKPVREGSVDALDRLAEATPAEGCTTATGVVGDNEGKSFVRRSRPKCSLAKTGMAHDGNPFGVYLGIRLKIVQTATKAPSPACD